MVESKKASVVDPSPNDEHKDDHNESVIVEEHKASIVESQKDEQKASVV